MNFSIEDGELPILPLNFDDAKLDNEFPLLQNDKCNVHIFGNPMMQKKQMKKKERIRRPLEPGQLVGHWNWLEKKKYHWFLEMYHCHFENKHMRRMDKIFKSMATFIGSRAADQCRSHHQKMEKKCGTFHNILYQLRHTHYNGLGIEQMIEELDAQGVACPGDLIGAFPLESMVTEIKLEQGHVKLEPEPVHYNFFGEREYEYTDHALTGLAL